MALFYNLFAVGRGSQSLFRVTSVELGPSVTFPLSPPEADVAADIVLRRLVPTTDLTSPVVTRLAKQPAGAVPPMIA